MQESKESVAKNAEHLNEYIHKTGTLTFPASTKEEIQYVEIDVVDDDDFEDEMEFFIDLAVDEDAYVGKRSGSKDKDADATPDPAGGATPATSEAGKTGNDGAHAHVQIFGPTLSVIVIDDDDPGQIQWCDETIRIPCQTEKIKVPIKRTKGASGRITAKVHTEVGTAKPGLDYFPVGEEGAPLGTSSNSNAASISSPSAAGGGGTDSESAAAAGELSASTKQIIDAGVEDPIEVVLENEELETEIELTFPVKTAKRVRDNLLFRVIMTEPTGGATISKDTDGGEDACICTVQFKGEAETSLFLKRAKSTLASNWEAAKLGSSSWGQQFTESLYCNGSAEEQAEASAFDWVLHVLCFPWKLVCACCPPPIYLNGWATFTGALIVISFQTALIADVAEMVGCTLDIPDSVTAITLVALGTSLPDTFASRTAALQDEYADSSITNVTGSNSVNVFLGLGIPWVIGWAYYARMP